MRVAILGSGGQLGSDLHTVIPTADPFFRSKLDFLTLSSQDKIEGALGKTPNWDYIINCAAITDVNYCEANPSEAMMVNFTAVKEIALYCQKHKIHLIHFSSDFVFDGETGNYREDSKRNPVNVYGKSKLDAEDIIGQYLPGAFTTIRTSSLFGVALGKTNFIEKIISAGIKRQEVKTLNCRRFVPTSTKQLALKVVEKLQKKMPCGVFHSVCGSPASQTEIANFIFQSISYLSHVKVVGQDSQKVLPRRPNDSSLISSSEWKLPDWKQEIQNYLLQKGYSRPACVTEVEADAPYSVSKIWAKLGRVQPNYPELVEALRQDRTNFILGKKPKKGTKKSLSDFMNQEVKL